MERCTLEGSKTTFGLFVVFVNGRHHLLEIFAEGGTPIHLIHESWLLQIYITIFFIYKVFFFIVSNGKSIHPFPSLCFVWGCNIILHPPIIAFVEIGELRSKSAQKFMCHTLQGISGNRKSLSAGFQWGTGNPTAGALLFTLLIEGEARTLYLSLSFFLSELAV